MQYALLYDRIQQKSGVAPGVPHWGRSKDRTSKQKQSIIQMDHFTAAFYKRSIDKKRFACIDLQIEVTHRDYCSSSSYPLIIENAQFISLTLEKS